MLCEFCWWSRAVLVLLVLGTLSGCGSGGNQYVEPPPPEVSVARPIQQSVTEYLEETGETEAAERAEVRARVRGFIEAIGFEPGQVVEKGMLLYRIQREEYEAAVDSAEAEVDVAKASISVGMAEKATAQAEANRAARDLSRQRSLVERGATSQTQLEQAIAADESAKARLESAESAIEAARAQLKQAEAKLADAKLDLSYTEVKAPIAGRVTKTEVKLGNLVDNGTELAAIVDDSRIYANFSVSDRKLLQLRAQQRERSTAEKAGQAGWKDIPVFLRRDLDKGFPLEGQLNYVDTEGVDPATGTLALRAVYENPQGLLFPGLFVSVRIPLRQSPDALLVPELAVQRDRVGDHLLVVDADDNAQRRAVQVGQREAGWAVIEEGLNSDDLVIVSGLQRARSGAPVTPMETNLSVEESVSFPPSETPIADPVDEKPEE